MEYWSDVNLQLSRQRASVPILQYSNTPILSPRAQLVHGVDQGDDVIDRRLRQHAVA